MSSISTEKRTSVKLGNLEAVRLADLLRTNREVQEFIASRRPSCAALVEFLAAGGHWTTPLAESSLKRLCEELSIPIAGVGEEPLRDNEAREQIQVLAGALAGLLTHQGYELPPELEVMADHVELKKRVNYV